MDLDKLDQGEKSREDGCHSPVAVLGGQTGTMYPPSVLDRILFATRYTRHLDRNGYLRFQNWKLYGERGLPYAPVTVWIYEGSLKVEHQAVRLSQYSVELQDDRKHLQKVGSPRLVETPFRSPQLMLSAPPLLLTLKQRVLFHILNGGKVTVPRETGA